VAGEKWREESLSKSELTLIGDFSKILISSLEVNGKIDIFKGGIIHGTYL